MDVEIDYLTDVRKVSMPCLEQYNKCCMRAGGCTLLYNCFTPRTISIIHEID